MSKTKSKKGIRLTPEQRPTPIPAPRIINHKKRKAAIPRHAKYKKEF